MKKIRNTIIIKKIEEERKDWRRNPNDADYLKRTYKKYIDLFSSYLPDYCIEGVKRLYESGDMALACQLIEGYIVENKPIWFLANLLDTQHSYATIQHSELLEKVLEIVAKRYYRKMYQGRYDMHFSHVRRTLREYMNKVAQKMAEMSGSRRFDYYKDTFSYTQDVKEFRFRLSTHGAEHYRFTFDFFKYEYFFCEKRNSFIFTRRIDKGKNEVICFIAQLNGYWRQAKLLKGIYNRSTDEFTPKNINFIQKHL